MPGKIFISYRRDDAPGDARGIRDALAARFGKASIFMDVDNLLAGQRFDEELAKALDACDVLIAIIGSRWTELLDARMAAGDRDYIRQEIAAALNRTIVVIPVRVGREGVMPPLPRPEELPEDIRDLLLYQRQDVAHERFGRDAAQLAALIIAVRRRRGPRKPLLAQVRWGRFGVIAASVLAVGWIGAHQLRLPVWWPWQSAPATLAPSQADLDAAARKNAEAEEVRLADEAKRRADEVVARPRDPVAALELGSGQGARDLMVDGTPCQFCPEMVVAPAGPFTMGSTEYDDEKPPHRVTISKPFAVGRYAITFGEWDACVADGGCNGYKPEDQGWGRGRRPVINVSWVDAKAYISWLSRKTGKAYRLPSEAEREYVTRSGTQTAFWWGDQISTSQANYNGNYTYRSGKGEYRKKTVPVDSFDPNPWGLYQVHGNVSEWCEDNWHENYKAASTDGSVSSGGDSSRRVVRGGSWSNGPRLLRSAVRLWYPPDGRDLDVGFRVARTL